LARPLIEGTAEVTVVEPPIAVNPEVKERPFTNGIVAGIIERIAGKRVKVRSSKYDSSKRMLTLNLIAE
jgi:hypothetical protein